MRAITVALATLALAACSREAEETTVTDEATAEAPMPAETTASATTPGTYDVKMADGTTMTSTLNADWTYVDTDASGAETERGTWSATDGKTCFDPEGDDPEMCFTDGGRNPDGSWIATGADGTSVTVMRRDEPAAPTT